MARDGARLGMVAGERLLHSPVEHRRFAMTDCAMPVRGQGAREKNFCLGGVLLRKAVATVATVTKVKNGLKMMRRGRKMVKKTRKSVI